jgi:AcrR family transcriptional regulator
MTNRRARTEADKAGRRADILVAAATTFDRSEFDAFTMEAVAGELGLAKGTLYRYFPTREGLLLEVLRGELDDWFAEIDGAIARVTSARGVADRLVTTLTARARMLRLLAVLPSVLERNVPYETALDFKTFLLDHSARTGALLDTALSARKGSGSRLLVQLNAGVIGLYLGAHPSPVVAEVLAQPSFVPLRVDLRRELTHLTRALVGAISKDTRS